MEVEIEGDEEEKARLSMLGHHYIWIILGYFRSKEPPYQNPKQRSRRRLSSYCPASSLYPEQRRTTFQAELKPRSEEQVVWEQEELSSIAPDAAENNRCGHGFELGRFLEDCDEDRNRSPREIPRGKEFGASNLRETMPKSIGYRLR
ncbi:hypothetical protein Taro_042386, partial [Colocasia esculenta]|nr:hypothetical protein [Colocasia esculenta]